MNHQLRTTNYPPSYIYGINPAFEVITAGRRTIYEAFIADTSNPRIKKLLPLLEKKNIKISLVDKGKLINLIRNKYHQGVVLCVSDYPYVPFHTLFDSNKLLLLDNIEDPQNMGAILRSAEVMGFNSVMLARRGTPEIYSSVVKVSAGATEHLRITQDLNANSYVKKAKEQGYTIISLDENGKHSIPEIAVANPEKIMLVIGGEDKSIGKFILNESHFILGIKQQGKINSLNASVAAGVGMYMISTLAEYSTCCKNV